MQWTIKITINNKVKKFNNKDTFQTNKSFIQVFKDAKKYLDNLKDNK